MGLFSKRIGPVFLKETNDTDAYIEKLQNLEQKASGNAAKEIQKQIKWMIYGKKGESNVAYELKNSGLDMYILHDIYLEYGNLSAQIDYLVITRKHTYIIECKMLSGNIEIDNTGAFIRYYEYSGKTFRKGMYSPVTQNRMHLQVIKEIWLHNKENIFTRKNFEKNFDTNFHSIVVLANPETCINMKYAPKDIKEQVIRADQLITYIRQKDSNSKNNLSNGDMLDAAKFYLNQHKPNKLDYSLKFEELLRTADMNPHNTEEKEIISNDNDTPYTAKTEDTQTCPPLKPKYNNSSDAKETLMKHLKDFRLKQSRNEGIVPYLIFNNAQMDDLIAKMPRTADELLKVSGFNAVKVNKYGDIILYILRNYNDKNPEKNKYERLVKNLKEYRLRQSKAEGIAPYLIFNDSQMEDLIFKMPHTTDELLKVSGFGAIKADKYGESIIKILWESNSTTTG